jgi:hypothetical protein
MRRALPPLVLSGLLLGCPSSSGDDASMNQDAFIERLDAALPDAPGLDAPFEDTPGPAPDAFSDPAGDAPTRTLTYAGTDAIFASPERGFYRAVDLLAERDLGWLRDEHPHDSLVYSYVMLDRFRDGDIDADHLTRIRDALDVARRAGFEVVLRFAYNLGPYPDPDPDAPLSRIQRHLEQLAPILRENVDVLAVVQAGFIGAWGEWHSSTHDLDADPAARRAVVEALLSALPPSRSTQVRYPPYIGELEGGSPLDATRAWTGTFESRIGYHNDCFVSSDTDVGTYPEDAVDRWKTFLDAHTAFVPVGGETCDPFPPRSACASTLAEMERHHYSFINRDYHPDIVQGWADGGCLETMERRLGYRLALLDASLPERVRPGGSFRLRIHLRNEGFAAPFNARPVELVLTGASGRDTVVLDTDVRTLLPGEHTIEARVRVPVRAAGDYTLALRLPSASISLADTPAFSIRLANEGTWQDATGDNTLGTLTLDDAAGGTIDPTATTLGVLD